MYFFLHGVCLQRIFNQMQNDRDLNSKLFLKEVSQYSRPMLMRNIALLASLRGTCVDTDPLISRMSDFLARRTNLCMIWLIFVMNAIAMTPLPIYLICIKFRTPLNFAPLIFRAPNFRAPADLAPL